MRVNTGTQRQISALPDPLFQLLDTVRVYVRKRTAYINASIQLIKILKLYKDEREHQSVLKQHMLVVSLL